MAFSQSVQRLAAPAIAATCTAVAHLLHCDSEADALYLAKLSSTKASKAHDHPVSAVAPVSTATPAPRAAQPPAPKVRVGDPIVDVAGINAAVLAAKKENLSDTASPGASSVDLNTGMLPSLAEQAQSAHSESPIATEAHYLRALEAQIVHQVPTAKFAPTTTALEVKTGADASSIHREIAVVAITRGCHPAVAEAVSRAVQAAAAADKLGFTYYIISDATPDSLVEHLEKALHAEIPARYDEISSGLAKDDQKAYMSDSAAGSLAGLETPEDGAIPVVAVFDRAAATQRKFIMPPSVHPDELAGKSSETAAVEPVGYAKSHAPPHHATVDKDGHVHTSILYEGEDEDLPPMVQLLLASVPYPSEIAAHTEAFAWGELKPTLLGLPRPAGDHYPGHGPHLTQVVSESWEELVLDPRKDVLLEAYLTHCPMCMCLAPRLRMLAYLMHNYGPRADGSIPAAGAKTGEPLVRVAVMNVDDNERPVDWMPGPAFPTIQLFAKGSGANGSEANGSGTARPWTKAHGAGCGPAARSALATLEGYGVAFPHGHLPTADKFEGQAGVPPHSHTRPGAGGHVTSKYASVTAAVQAAYKGVVGQSEPAQASQGHPAASRLSAKGTPACVPSLDFSHPTQPGKSALPSVTDLVYWLGAHCSAPFDPATITVPAAEFKNSRDKMVELGMLPPPTAQQTTGSGATAKHGGADRITLLELAADMDAESRAYESAVFDSFYYNSMLTAYKKACSGEATAADEDGHKDKDGEDLPPAYSAPLSTYANSSKKAVLPLFSALIDRLKAVGIDGAAYGQLEPTVEALEALTNFVDDHGIRDGARAWLLDQAEGKAVGKAAKIAAQLAAKDKVRGARGQAKARMQ